MSSTSLPPFKVLMLSLVAIFSGCHCIDVENNSGLDSTVVLVDGSMGGVCVNDSIYRATDATVSLGTYETPGACNEEMVIFSDGDAVKLIQPVPVFSSTYGSEIADLTPDLTNVPIVVWRADGISGAAAPATTEVALANSLFDGNNAGIQFTATYQNVNAADSTTINDVAISVWNGGVCTVGNVTGNASIYNTNQINVYYTTRAFTGWHCGASNIIMIGTLAQPESLTHEFGHAFTLSHTQNVDYNGDGVNDFAAANIMIGGGFGRVTFSEGQGFRMSLNSTSDLNGLGYRTGATRSCTDSAISSTCPWLGLDVTPN